MSERLLVRDVQVQKATYTDRTYQRAVGMGSVLSGRVKLRQDVKITAELRLWSQVDRDNVIADLIAWMKDGGKLEISARPDKYLTVVCTEYPQQEAKTGNYPQITFTLTAYECPYFIDSEPTTVTIASKTSGGSSVQIPGNADYAPVDVTVTPVGTLREITLVTNTESIRLSGLTATTPVTITHADGNIVITCAGQSLMKNRTADSSDDLKIPCGRVSGVSCSANTTCTVTYSARGRWE